MSLSDLRESIDKKSALLAIIGLGYVGLPVATEFARAGFDVIGVEQIVDRVKMINSGQLPMTGIEPGLQSQLNQVLADGKFRATTDYREISNREIVLICVETPVNPENIPDYQALRSTVNSLGKVMKNGSLIIIESTVSPGTMSGLVQPFLEQSSQLNINDEFYLGISPERVMPGKLLANLRTVNRVVGGMTPETAETMAVLYRQITNADVDITDCLTAELVKCVENAYRDVQIAFANEIAIICESIGGDVWRVRELVNKSPGRQMLLPGVGVGGHCIPKDPWLLVHSVNELDVHLRLILAARQVNASMPEHFAAVIRKILKKERVDLNQARILILGYAYLEETDDSRNSPSEALQKHLTKMGAEVILHDPYVPGYGGHVPKLAHGCDMLVVAVKHELYRTLHLNKIFSVMRTPILVDGRGFMDPDLARQAGFKFYALGRDLIA